MKEHKQIAIIRHLGGLVFDAVLKEVHSSDLEVTDNPVETGVVISDHAYMKPLALTIMAAVSDVSLRKQPNDPFESEYSRSIKAYEMLMDLQKKAEPFDVQTGLKLYSNMICKSVKCEQDKDSSGLFEFTAELREVQIVSTQVVKYAPRKDGQGVKGSTNRQAGKIKTQGEQQGKPVEDKKQKATLLQKGSEVLKGFMK